MSRLTNLLEYSYAGNSERKQIINRPEFDYLFNKSEKQLIQSEAEETELIIREIVGAIVEGAKSRESARKVLPIINTKSNTCRVLYGGSPSGQYASYVAEGAAIPIETINHSGTTIVTKKAAVRPVISQELIDDSSFDLVELELKKAGAKLENKLNQQVITTFLNGVNGPANVDPAGSHIAMSDIGDAKGNVDALGWMADSVFLHPQAYGWMVDETNLGDITGKGNPLIHLNMTILDAATDGTVTVEWDPQDAADNYYGLIFDSYNYGVIAMREDINTSKIKDPIHDLTHIVAKMRFGVGILNANAGCRILSK